MNNLQKIMSYLMVLYPLMVSVTYANAVDQSPFAVQNNLLLRTIAHQFLRASGDSISRILPVENVVDNGYRLNFQNRLGLLPDSLAKVVIRLGRNGELPQRYSLIVTEIRSGKIVYGFTSADVEHGTIPCIGRSLPKGDYALALYVFPATAKTGSNRLVLWVGVIFFVMFIVTGTIYYSRKNKRGIDSKIAVDNDHRLAGTVSLGRYTFDPGKRLLIIDQEQTILTAKELTLLNILIKKINQIMDRNTLLKEGWEDEGVITGRSLDMYVSKLRKKLQKDPLIKITNFHGRGYSLEIQSD